MININFSGGTVTSTTHPSLQGIVPPFSVDVLEAPRNVQVTVNPTQILPGGQADITVTYESDTPATVSLSPPTQGSVQEISQSPGQAVFRYTAQAA